MQAAKTK